MRPKIRTKVSSTNFRFICRAVVNRIWRSLERVWVICPPRSWRSAEEGNYWTFKDDFHINISASLFVLDLKLKMILKKKVLQFPACRWVVWRLLLDENWPSGRHGRMQLSRLSSFGILDFWSANISTREMLKHWFTVSQNINLDSRSFVYFCFSQ